MSHDVLLAVDQLIVDDVVRSLRFGRCAGLWREEILSVGWLEGLAVRTLLQASVVKERARFPSTLCMKTTASEAYRPLLSETGGISDGLILVKKPCWFDVKA